jgi:hypothetical protein
VLGALTVVLVYIRKGKYTMPHYMVFQQQLTDEQIDAVNLGQGSPEAAAYFKLHSLNEAMAQKTCRCCQ